MIAFTSNPSYIYIEELTRRTKILSMEDGGEQRSSFGTPRRIFTLNFDKVTKVIKDSIVDFYDARQGRFEAFGWINPNDSITYDVKFLPNSLEVEEIDYQMYNIQFQLIEVVKGDFALLETGDKIILETGDKIILEGL